MATNGDQADIVRAAYDALLERVAEGRITATDPVVVLVELNEAWALPDAAPRLAAALLEYARQQVGAASTAQGFEREGARRQRLYGVTQQVYERIRLSPRAAAATPT